MKKTVFDRQCSSVQDEMVTYWWDLKAEWFFWCHAFPMMTAQCETKHRFCGERHISYSQNNVFSPSISLFYKLISFAGLSISNPGTGFEFLDSIGCNLSGESVRKVPKTPLRDKSCKGSQLQSTKTAYSCSSHEKTLGQRNVHLMSKLGYSLADRGNIKGEQGP